jgi:two-component system, sensor histidine kinase SagS
VTIRPRLLVIDPSPGSLDCVLTEADVERTSQNPAEVAQRLAEGRFSAVLASPEVAAGLFNQFRTDELILGHIDKGLAVLDPGGTITWANSVFQQYTHGDPLGHPFLTALGGMMIASDEEDPLAPARHGLATSVRLHCPTRTDQPYLEASIRPVINGSGEVSRLVVMVRDVTPEVVQQQKLDALHQAGLELAGLDAEQLAEMNVSSRVELLKHNLRRFIHDLLQYDTIEVRLLDRKTGELKLLLEDGMLPEAAVRVLYAQPTGNGVTGYVAATGKSYLCGDTANDPHYIVGSAGARSSMTVPLKYHDEVIGTLNVESPRERGFGPDDLQFTELFSKEIAAALHTLDLLSAQQVCTASQSIEAVNKGIALPLDEILAGASVLLGQLQNSDPVATERLSRILVAARQVKESVTGVGRSLADSPGAPPANLPLLGKRVLVIESEERLRRAAHLLLTRLGATVETAGNGVDGVAMALDTNYDAIFQEVKPPDLGGYDCYRRLRSARPAAVLSLTTGFGYDNAHSIVKARADGLKYVLFKPFRQEQVVSAVLDGCPPRAQL